MPQKHSLTLSIDQHVWKKFDEIAKQLRLTPSREIQFLMELWIREKEKSLKRRGFKGGWEHLVVASLLCTPAWIVYWI